MTIRSLKDLSDIHLQKEISNILSDIVVNRLGLWIVCNGGWVRNLPTNLFISIKNIDSSFLTATSIEITSNQYSEIVI